MLRKFFTNQPRNQSIVDALSKLLSKKQLSKLASEIKDPREVLDLALSLNLKDQTYFINQLSKLIAYPWNEDSSEVSLALIEQLPVNKLEKLAAYPVILSGNLVAIAAVDPLIAKQSLEAPDNFQFRLTTYQAVKDYWQQYQESKCQAEFAIKMHQKFRGDLFNKVIHYAEETASYVQTLKFKNQKIFVIKAEQEVMLLEGVKEIDWLQITNEFIEQKLEIVTLKDQVTLSVYTNQDNCLVLSYVQPPAFNSDQVSDTTLNQQQVLVIDDSPVFTKVLERNLNHLKYNLKTFNNSVAATKFIKASSRKIDLIICDLHMPDFDGDQLREEVKDILCEQQIPFFILSSDSEIDTQLRMYRQGIDNYLTKDEDPRLIVGKIEAALVKQLKIH